MARKPRSDSTLKTLTAERQAAIVDYLRDHTLADAVKWLAEDGITTSSAALSLFHSWYADQLAADSLMDLLEFGESAARGKFNPEQARAKAIEWAMAIAKAKSNPELMLNAVSVSQGERKVGVTERKLELELTKYKDTVERIKGDLVKAKSKGGLTPETLENIERELKLL